MSKHIGRKQRWTQKNAGCYSSAFGEVVYQERAWYALLTYRTLLPPQTEGALAQWQEHSLRLGPFKRPRNAMVALEREVTILKNRHGPNLLLKDEVWAER